LFAQNNQENNVIISMSAAATEAETNHVIDRVRELGYQAHVTRGVERTIVAAVGAGHREELAALGAAPGVEQIVAIAHIVNVGGVPVGGEECVLMAGPCSVESREQLMTVAHAIRDAGASMLRGGAYKPRTSPYEFQGLGIEALKLLREASDATGLPVVTEVMSTEDVDVVSEYADMLQVGARNMQNFSLLRRLAKCERPVLLKRSPSATVKDWLLAAEYILAGGNDDVVLCERGIRSYDPDMRNTFDLSALALARQLSHLPVVADPSHGTGRRDLVPIMARASVAVGADGVIVEVHPCPEKALSDGPQSLTIPEFAALVQLIGQPMRKHLRQQPKAATA
jgi:3-deoxy-7-phosphoheptulonate synthase